MSLILIWSLATSTPPCVAAFNIPHYQDPYQLVTDQFSFLHRPRPLQGLSRIRKLHSAQKLSFQQKQIRVKYPAFTILLVTVDKEYDASVPQLSLPVLAYQEGENRITEQFFILSVLGTVMVSFGILGSPCSFTFQISTIPFVCVCVCHFERVNLEKDKCCRV